MALFEPIYRLTVYDTDGVTPLTPPAGAPHGQQFQIASATGVTGFYPYLGLPRGRRGRINPITRRADTGEIVVEILDVRVTPGGTNAERWFTAFISDTEGNDRTLGKRAVLEESTNGGSTWADAFTGRIYSPALSGRTRIALRIRDEAESLEDETFIGAPHSSITYAHRASLMPAGHVLPYANFQIRPKLPATLNTAYGYLGHDVLEVDVTALAAIDTDRTANVITRGFYNRLLEANPATSDQYLAVHPGLRIRAEIMDGPSQGATGDFYPSAIISLGGLFAGYSISFIQEDVNARGQRTMIAIGIAPVDPSDPNYLAVPANGTSIEFYIVGGSKPPTREAPLLVNDVHPATFLADIADGKFSRIDTDGTVVRTYPRDAASFAAIEADDSFPLIRQIITDSETINDIYETICQQTGLGYRLNSSGEIVLLDMRRPTDLTGVPTITNDDIDTAAPAPAWERSLETAITRIDVRHYVDEEITSSDIAEATPQNGIPNVDESVRSDRLDFIKLDIGNPDIFERRLRIDATGFRMTVGEESINGLERAEWIRRRLDELTEEFLLVYADGATEIALPCRRTSNTNGAAPGDLWIVDVDELPNMATRQRGGSQLIRLTEVTEDGPRMLARGVSLGATALANAPTIGTVILTSGAESLSIQIPITTNAAGDPVACWTAVTETDVGTRPAVGDALWLYGGRRVNTGTLQLWGYPAGKRIWVRGRSEPRPVDGIGQLPSVWAYPSGAGYVDTTAIPTPTGFSATADGINAILAWTPGSAFYSIEVWLKQGTDEQRLVLLEPGTKAYTIYGLAETTLYTASIRHVDSRGGTGPFATDNFTTGNIPTAPDMLGAVILVGERG